MDCECKNRTYKYTCSKCGVTTLLVDGTDYEEQAPIEHENKNECKPSKELHEFIKKEEKREKEFAEVVMGDIGLGGLDGVE